MKIKMKENRLKISLKGIARKSIGIWLSLIVYIVFTIILVIGNDYENKLSTLILWNCVNVLIFFPGLFIHIEYIINGLNKEIIIDNEAITILKHGKEIKKIKTKEIKNIISIDTYSWSRFPWWELYYYKIVDINGNSIKISCYIFKDGEIWENQFLRKNKDNLLITKEVFLPSMIEFQKY